MGRIQESMIHERNAMNKWTLRRTLAQMSVRCNGGEIPVLMNHDLLGKELCQGRMVVDAKRCII